MSQGATVAELIDLAIEAEESAEQLYREMARKFAHHEEAANFWQRYAGVEAEHAQWLRRIQKTVSPRRLSAPIDFQVFQDAQKLQQIVPKTLQGIDNLENAYQLAHELEHSEVNAVFEVLVTNLSEDDEAGKFLRAQLREHVAMLNYGFPADLQSSAARRKVKAQT